MMFLPKILLEKKKYAQNVTLRTKHECNIIVGIKNENNLIAFVVITFSFQKNSLS